MQIADDHIVVRDRPQVKVEGFDSRRLCVAASSGNQRYVAVRGSLLAVSG
jgi:hypothetical protein